MTSQDYKYFFVVVRLLAQQALPSQRGLSPSGTSEVSAVKPAQCGRAGHRSASLGHGQPPPGKAARARWQSPAPSVTSLPGPSAPTRAVCSASSAGRPRSHCPPFQTHPCPATTGCSAAKLTVRYPAPHYHLPKLRRADMSQPWRAAAPPARVPAVPCPPLAPTGDLWDTTAMIRCNPTEKQAELQVQHPWNGDALRTSWVGLL